MAESSTIEVVLQATPEQFQQASRGVNALVLWTQGVKDVQLNDAVLMDVQIAVILLGDARMQAIRSGDGAA